MALVALVAWGGLGWDESKDVTSYWQVIIYSWRWKECEEMEEPL